MAKDLEVPNQAITNSMASSNSSHADRGAVEHRYSDFYSGDKPVPNVQKFIQQRGSKEAQLDNTEIDDRAEEGTGEREVWDPITRRTVAITDRGGMKSIQDTNITVPKEALRDHIGDGERTHVSSEEGESHSEGREKGVAEDPDGEMKDRGNGFVDVPLQGDKTNILFFPFPAPEWDYYHREVRKVVTWYGVGLVVASYIVHFANLSWIFGIVAAILMAFAVYNLDKRLVASWLDVKFDVERQRGRSVSQLII
jgi:hypothetical protein